MKNFHWRVRPGLIVERRLFTVTIDLSLVVVRWKNYWQDKSTDRSHNVLNQDLIQDVLDKGGSFKEFFGSKGNYEVFTIAETADDINAIEISTLPPCLRRKQKCALYFLWPTQKKALEKIAAGALRSLTHRMETPKFLKCFRHRKGRAPNLMNHKFLSRLLQEQ